MAGANPLDMDALERVLAGEFSRQGLLLTRFVLVSEQLHADGDQTLNVAHSADLRLWDAAGMLRCAVLDVDARVSAEWAAEPGGEVGD
jgi:hypothetical protein